MKSTPGPWKWYKADPPVGAKTAHQPTIYGTPWSTIR